MEDAGTTHERVHWDASRLVAGIDEVGRGAWAGPVTVGAVALDPGRPVAGLRDSKTLTAPARERLDAHVRGGALGVGIGHASNDEVDALGLAAALTEAARRALDALVAALRAAGLGGPDVVLVDGPHPLVRREGVVEECHVRGDRVSASIAAASIVAKVARDALLSAAEATHPGYAFAANKGYPSPAHLAALDRLGACALHRRSWAPLVALDAPRLL